jgi:hypothetical protein
MEGMCAASAFAEGYGGQPPRESRAEAGEPGRNRTFNLQIKRTAGGRPVVSYRLELACVRPSGLQDVPWLSPVSSRERVTLRVKKPAHRTAATLLTSSVETRESESGHDAHHPDSDQPRLRSYQKSGASPVRRCSPAIVRRAARWAPACRTQELDVRALVRDQERPPVPLADGERRDLRVRTLATPR